MNISSSLKILRKKYNLTQKSLAEALGLSRQMIYLMENNKAKASKKTINLLIKKFPTDFGKQEKKYTKKEINEFEKEILETYEMLREENNPFTAIASFKRSLINLNQEISKTSININTLEENPDFKKISIRLKRPIKTTLKYLELIKNQLNDIINTDYIIIEEEDINESE